MHAILFDDARGILSPLNDLRPSFDVRTGALTTLERLRRRLKLEVIALYVPDALIDVTQESHSIPVNTLPEVTPGVPILGINGRCPLPLDLFERLEPGQVAIEGRSGDMVAVCLDGPDMELLLTGGEPAMESIEIDGHVLMGRPWQWLDFRADCLDNDLELLRDEPDGDVPYGALVLGEHKCVVHPEARVYQGAVLNCEGGPIVVGAGAVVRPLAVVEGPAYVGAGSTLLEHAHVKAYSAIGPACKIAGEVGGCVFQGFANKAHDGHLGDAWVGEWVNLGAGTTNSNLLNTYTDIKAAPAPGAETEDTGHAKLGCVLGDHVKLAICTRIMAGAVVGTATMWASASPATGAVGAFAWRVDGDDGDAHWRLGKFIESAMKVMDRRGVIQSQAYARRLTLLHEHATGEDSGMDWPGKRSASAP